MQPTGGTIAKLKCKISNCEQCRNGKKRIKKQADLPLFSHKGLEHRLCNPPFPSYPRSPLYIQIHFSSIKFSQETVLSSCSSLELPISQEHLFPSHNLVLQLRNRLFLSAAPFIRNTTYSLMKTNQNVLKSKPWAYAQHEALTQIILFLYAWQPENKPLRFTDFTTSEWSSQLCYYVWKQRIHTFPLPLRLTAFRKLRMAHFSLMAGLQLQFEMYMNNVLS